MIFSDIQTLTYIGSTAIINGQALQIVTALPPEILAVQYHRGRSVIEEPSMVTVNESKYQYALDQWEEARRILELPKVYTAAELAQQAEDAKPKVVTMRQARLALQQNNLLAAVDATIATGADEAMKIEWEYATEVRRDWPSLNVLATALGMTSTQLDELFILASTK